MSELLDIHTDNSSDIIGTASKLLSQKGVLTEWNNEGSDVVGRAEGMANKRKATYRAPLQSLKDLSEEQIDDKVNEIVSHITSVIQAGGEKENENV